jgi:hypothetical protein
MAATPAANCVSPTGFIASGPSARWKARAWTSYRRTDIVALPDVGQELVEQVAPAWPVPEVMMRIADRLRRIEDIFHVAAQP